MKKPHFARTLLHRSIVSILTVSLATASLPSRANGNWLESFFHETGAYVNTTNGGAFQGQSMNVMTGGSLFMRVPQKNYQLVSFQPPSISAGCGGIDLFTGSFSFINKEQFVAMLRNIGQAAIGQAFMLALKSMAPEVAEVMQALQRVAQDANGSTLNACAEGKKLVDGVMGDYMSANSRQAADWSLALNRDADGMEAYKRNRGSLSEYQLSLADAKNNLSGVKPKPGSDASPAITEGNVVWRALSMEMPSLTNAEKLMLMSISGTIIFDNPANAEPTIGVKPSILKFKDIIGDTGATFQQYECTDGTSDNACRKLNPIDFNTKTFKALVSDRFREIKTNMLGRTAQSASNIDYTEMISLPVQRVLAVGTNIKSPLMNQVLNERIEQIAAAEIAANFVRMAIEVTRKAVAQSIANKPFLEAEQLKALDIQLQATYREVLEELRTAHASGNTLAGVTREVESLERAMQASLPSSIARSLAFERSQK